MQEEKMKEQLAAKKVEKGEAKAKKAKGGKKK